MHVFFCSNLIFRGLVFGSLGFRSPGLFFQFELLYGSSGFWSLGCRRPSSINQLELSYLFWSLDLRSLGLVIQLELSSFVARFSGAWALHCLQSWLVWLILVFLRICWFICMLRMWFICNGHYQTRCVWIQGNNHWIAGNSGISTQNLYSSQTDVGWRREQVKRPHCKQHKVASDDPVNRQGASHCVPAIRRSLRGSCAEWNDSERLRVITTTRLKSDSVNTWNTSGHALLDVSAAEVNFPLSNIASYDLAQEKITNLWDVQRSELAIEADSEREKQFAKGAALVLHPLPPQFEDLSNSIIGWRFKFFGLKIF